MINEPIRNFPSTEKIILGKSYFLYRRKVRGHHMPAEWHGFRSTVYSNFERYEYLSQNIDQVIEWATPKLVESPSDISLTENDLGISIRRGWMNWPADDLCPDYDYYVKLLEKFEFKRLLLFTDSPDDKYFDKMKKDYAGKLLVIRGSAIQQFSLIGKLNRYICAPSTFSFWASIVGKCSEVYWPRISALDFSQANHSWFPDNLKNHRYI